MDGLGKPRPGYLTQGDLIQKLGPARAMTASGSSSLLSFSMQPVRLRPNFGHSQGQVAALIRKFGANVSAK